MSDERTVLQAFRDALVDAMAAEMTILRAPREQWEVAAQGVMNKMGVRGVPALALTRMDTLDAVLFTRQDRAELPPVPRERAHGEAGEDPVVEVRSDPERGEQGDGADRATGDAP